MRISIVVFALCAFSIVSVMTGCTNSADQVEDAEANVTKAENDLAVANQEYLAEVEAYREESAMRIAANQKSIDEFNMRIANEKKDVRSDYKQKIAMINEKNTDLKRRLDQYKAEGKEQWVTFKSEMNREMDDLGQSINDLFKD